MKNEKRLIDANAVMKEAHWIIRSDGTRVFVIHAEDMDNTTTVDAVEVVHGRWEPRTDALGFVRCSACRDCNIYDDWADGKKWQYCPNCGAKMDGGKTND